MELETELLEARGEVGSVRIEKTEGGEPCWSVIVTPETTDEELGRMVRQALSAYDSLLEWEKQNG